MPLSPPYTSGLGRAGSWQGALEEALATVAERAAGGAVGLLYIDERFEDALDLIVHELVRRTGVTSWFGTVSRGVFGSARAAVGDGHLAILLPPWDEARFRFLGGGHRSDGDRTPVSLASSCALVHGDGRLRRTLPLAAAEITGAGFTVGGITAARGAPMQVLHRPAEDELGALVLDPSIEVLAGISQACSPIGPSHEIDAADGSWIRRIDGRPAYAILREEIGEVLSRQPERIGGYIHLEVAGEAEDLGLVRPILALEPRSGEIATAEPLRRGQRVRFVKRDPAAARASFRAMLERLGHKLEGRLPAAGLYIASRARLTTLFEQPACEVRLVRDTFGPLPLVGFCSDGEIFDSCLHDWSSILVLFR